MAARNWNPSEPYALGLEWPGMRTLALPLSQDVEYGHTFQADTTENIDTATFELVPPVVPNDSAATALITVYKRDNNNVGEGGDELEYGLVTSQLVPVNGGTLSAPSVLINAATVAEALTTPSDQKYVSIPGGYVDVEFGTAGLFVGKRILELKVHFVGNPDTVVNPPVPDLNLSLRIGGVSVLAQTVDTDVFGQLSTVRKHSLGEVNYGGGALPLCWPWTVADVDLFDAGTVIRVFKATAANMRLHYMVLEVVWCEENRQAVGALSMSAAFFSASDEPLTPGRHAVALRQPDGTDNWPKVADNYYTVTLTSARSSDLGHITYSPAPNVPLVDSFGLFANHQGRVAPRLPTNVLGALGASSMVAPIKFVTTGATVPTDFAPYDAAFGAPVYNGGATQTQEIAQRSGGGTVTYPWIRFYARIVGDNTDVIAIDITTVDGTMNYFEGPLLLLPEIFDGWREVTLRWPAGQEPQISNAGTDKAVDFTTTQGSVANRWEILGVTSEFLMLGSNGNPTYGGAGTLYKTGATTHQFADLAVTLHTAAPAVAGFDGGIATADLHANLYGGVAVCEPTGFSAVTLVWTASSLATADFLYYEIQRQDTIDATWRTIAKLTTKATVQFSDVEARVGIASSYRMRIVRADRIEGAWTATETHTVPSTPNPCGTLYFSSNAAPVTDGHFLAYAEVFDGSPVEDYGFVEASSVVQQRMYGRYGTQSFHPTERGGVRFERDIVINALAVPDAYADREFQALRDLAWAAYPYVCVKDDLGNRWFATLIVPSGSMQRAPQLFIANIQVIESADVPYPVAAQA